MSNNDKTRQFDELLLKSACSVLANVAPDVATILENKGQIWIAVDGVVKNDAARDLMFETVRALRFHLEQKHGAPLWHSTAEARMTELSKWWSNSEQLIQELWQHMAGKFYRDHLNHVIRVGLVALHLLGSSEELSSIIRPDTLLLACLLHDIGIPEHKYLKISGFLQNMVAEPYGKVPINGEQPIVLNSDVTLDLACIATRNFAIANEKLTNDHSHSLFSALMLFRLLAKPLDIKQEAISQGEDSIADHLLRAIRSIAAHDSHINPNHLDDNETTDPYLGLLVVCDEAQEWGRWRDIGETSAILSLEYPIIDDNRWVFSFDYSPDHTTPCITTLYDKCKNFERLQYNGYFPHLEYTSKLPNPTRTMTLRQFCHTLCDAIYLLRWAPDDLLKKVGIDTGDAVAGETLTELYRSVARSSEDFIQNVLIWRTEYDDKVFNDVVLTDLTIQNLSLIMDDVGLGFRLGNQPVSVEKAETTPPANHWLQKCRRYLNPAVMWFSTSQGKKPEPWMAAIESMREFIEQAKRPDVDLMLEVLSLVACPQSSKWYVVSKS
jgi:hypothetical protein